MLLCAGFAYQPRNGALDHFGVTGFGGAGQGGQAMPFDGSRVDGILALAPKRDQMVRWQLSLLQISFSRTAFHLPDLHCFVQGKAEFVVDL